MGDYHIKKIDGVAYVLPAFETISRVKRLGGYYAFVNFGFDRFSLGGFQVLEAGLIMSLGPVYFGFGHIKRQHKAFERLRAIELANQ